MISVKFSRSVFVQFALVGIITGATYIRLKRPDIGYAVAQFLSYHYYGGYVDHRLTEAFIGSLGAGLLGGYISWVVMKHWETIKTKFKRDTRQT